jgi:hypothetical protein
LFLENAISKGWSYHIERKSQVKKEKVILFVSYHNEFRRVLLFFIVFTRYIDHSLKDYDIRFKNN